MRWFACVPRFGKQWFLYCLRAFAINLKFSLGQPTVIGRWLAVPVMMDAVTCVTYDVLGMSSSTFNVLPRSRCEPAKLIRSSDCSFTLCGLAGGCSMGSHPHCGRPHAAFNCDVGVSFADRFVLGLVVVAPWHHRCALGNSLFLLTRSFSPCFGRIVAVDALVVPTCLCWSYEPSLAVRMQFLKLSLSAPSLPSFLSPLSCGSPCTSVSM